MTRTFFSLRTSSAALVVAALVTGCGGGGGDGAAADPGGTTPTDPPAASGYQPDLASFAVGWLGVQMAQAALDLMEISGETGDCGLGGTATHDALHMRQGARLCRIRATPDNVYSGDWYASVKDAGDLKTASLGSFVLTMTAPDQPQAIQFALTAGNAEGSVQSTSDSTDVFSTKFGWDVRMGGSDKAYRYSTSAAMAATRTFAAGVPALEIGSAGLGVNLAGRAAGWRVTLQGLRMVGDAWPEQGSLEVYDGEASQPMRVTFGADRSLTFSRGGLSAVRHWNDADVQAALKAAR